MSRALPCLLSLLLVASLTPAVVSQDITSNLHAHWKLTETSATTAVDSSSTANHGTYMNGVTLANSTPVPSDGAVAARFDGSNDYVAIPNESNYDVVGAFSVAIWIKVNSFTTADQAILTKGASTSVQLQRDGTNNGIAFVCRGLTTIRVASTVSVNDGNWHHVVGVFTGSQLRLYIDGRLNNSVNTTGFISTNNHAVQIGANAEVAGKNFNGWLYDARLYNRALSAADVSYLYLQGGPIARWMLNETSGTTAADSSLYANSGTYKNSVTLGTSGPYPGAGERAASFNGSGQYIETSNEQLYDITARVAVAAWIKVDAFTISQQTIVSKGNSAWRLQREGATNELAFICSGLSNTKVVSATAVNDGRWHHIVGTYNGSTLSIYIDGRLDASVSATGSIATNDYNVFIAENADQSSRHWYGSLHDVRIYDRALSAAEVVQLFGFVGHWKLDQTSGTTASDSTLFASHGAVSGGANWSNRCTGTGVFDFDGSANYISVANATHLQPTSSLLIAAWIKGDSWSSGTEVNAILRKGEANPNNYQLAVADGRLALFLDDGDSAGFRSSMTLSTGTWYHVAATWDGATVKLYVNGQLDSSYSRSGKINTDTRTLYIGGRSGTDRFDGMIYDVRFYNRAIYTTDIAELYGLIGHWALNETSGTAAADSSGLGRNGSIYGNANWTAAGKIDNCLRLDGATRAEINSLMGRPKNVTIAGWANLTTPDSSGAEIVSIGDYFAMRLDEGTTTRAFFYTGSTWTGPSVYQTFTGAGWHHFAAVFNDDQNYCKLFIDGAEVASVNTTVTIPYSGLGTKTVIGAHGDSKTAFDFTGRIDDVRIYNRALCPSEIQTLFITGGGTFDGVKVIKWVELQ